MDSALAWIGQIADWIGKFFPRWVVLEASDGGVKQVGFMLPRAWRVRCGGFDGDLKIMSCQPGIHWYWPATTIFNSGPTARQTDKLPTQTFTLADDITIAIGGMLVYTVDDLAKLYTTTHSPMHAVQDIALTAVHDVCCRMTWTDLKDEERRGTLDTKLKNMAQRSLDDYGVKVIKCMLTDLTRTRALRVIQSVTQDSGL